jgi:hypothetical protein
VQKVCLYVYIVCMCVYSYWFLSDYEPLCCYIYIAYYLDISTYLVEIQWNLYRSRIIRFPRSVIQWSLSESYFKYGSCIYCFPGSIFFFFRPPTKTMNRGFTVLILKAAWKSCNIDVVVVIWPACFSNIYLSVFRQCNNFIIIKNIYKF